MGHPTKVTLHESSGIRSICPYVLPKMVICWNWSNRECNLAKGAPVNQVLQRIRGLNQWEGFRYDWFNGCRIQQREDGFPGLLPEGLRLSKDRETLDAGTLPNQMLIRTSTFPSETDGFGRSVSLSPS
jgi:hypothetical protein